MLSITGFNWLPGRATWLMYMKLYPAKKVIDLVRFTPTLKVISGMTANSSLS